MLDYRIIHVFTSESARVQGKPLHEAVVALVQASGAAARCVVTRGIAGCDEAGRIASSMVEALSYSMPLKIEIALPSAEAEALFEEIVRIAPEAIVGMQRLERAAHRVPRRLLPKRLRVRDVMTANPVAVTPDATGAEVARTLLTREFNGVPVVDDDGAPAGMITQRDLIERGGMPVRLGLLKAFGHVETDQGLETLTSKTAAELMSWPAISVYEDQRLDDAVRLMLERGLKRLPVVDVQGKLTGILSRLDVFRAISRHGEQIETESHAAEGAPKTVRDVMRRDAHTVGLEATLDEVLQVIEASDVQRVAVVDAEGRLLGVIVDRDLLGAFTEQKASLWNALTVRLSWTEAGKRRQELLVRAQGVTAAQLMRRDVKTVTEDMSLDEVVSLMADRAYKRLPVVDADGKFRGMISRDSVLRAGI